LFFVGIWPQASNQLALWQRHDLLKIRLNRKLPFLPIIGVVICSLPYLIEAQVPPNTKVSKDLIARFRSGTEPVRVLFYSYAPQQGIGFIILSRSGKLLAQAEIPDAISQAPQTGIYDVTGEGTPDIVVVGGVGAKTFEANIYSFTDSQLKEIFNWSGSHFEVVRLRGQRIIAITPTDYGTLPKLYRWRQGQFVESGQDFPEFFDQAIKTQQETIERSGFPAYVYAQACELAATALAYGKKYSDATNLCERGLNVVESSPGVIPNQIGGPPEELAAERLEAASRIRDTLKAVQVAKAQGSASLKQQ
jgi:hypothetical protein